jgi:hypothetical protein
VSNIYFKCGDKVIFYKNKSHLVVFGEIISHDDDSDEYIANVEEWIKIKTHIGDLAARGRHGNFCFTGKSLRRFGNFKVKKV